MARRGATFALELIVVSITGSGVFSSLVGNGRGVHGGRVADALNQLAASRENPARAGDRSLSAVASHPLPPAYIFLPGNAPPPPPPSNRGDCTRK